MTIRSASLLIASALAGAAAPALAQDGVYDPGPPPPLPEYQSQEWDEEWDEYLDEAPPSLEAHDDAPEDLIGALRAGDLQPTLRWQRAYSDEQRARWLEQCRWNHAEANGREEGQVIGGLLGAIAGGVAGNRIADGARLGGTLIGAGIGGLAGVAIGGAIGAAADRERSQDRLDVCEDYLLRYEQSFHGHLAVHGGYSQPCACGPVVWVRVPVVRHRQPSAAVSPPTHVEVQRALPDKRVRLAK